MAVRREGAATARINKRLADYPEQMAGALDEFYDQHASLISKDLGISIADAENYCQRQRENPVADEGSIRELTALALGGLDDDGYWRD